MKIVKLPVSADLLAEMFDLGPGRTIVGVSCDSTCSTIKFAILDRDAPDDAELLCPVYVRSNEGATRTIQAKYLP